MSNEKSCIGCKYMYGQDSGYSNYTVENTAIICALNKNKNLPKDEPHNWNQENDNWPATMDSRCDSYSAGGMVRLDVDGEDLVEDQTDDLEQLKAIKEDCGR